MYHFQAAFRPQNNHDSAALDSAALNKPDSLADSSPVSGDPIARPGSAARTDLQIEQDVRDELEMEPSVRAAAIGIQVRHGLVTLTGVVDGEGERWLIESAAKRIVGVKGVLTQLRAFAPDITPDDLDIAHDCERVLGHLTPKTDYAIQVMVSHGWVTLLGNVAEGYERGIAEAEVASLLSVHGVNSQVRVRPPIETDANANNARHGQHELKSGYEFAVDNDRVTWSSAALSCTRYRDMLYAAWSSFRTKNVATRPRSS